MHTHTRGCKHIHTRTQACTHTHAHTQVALYMVPARVSTQSDLQHCSRAREQYNNEVLDAGGCEPIMQDRGLLQNSSSHVKSRCVEIAEQVL
jgi:hypothetical protein